MAFDRKEYNRTKKKEIDKAYYEKHKEEIKARVKKYKKDNKKKVDAYNKKYREENKELCSQRTMKSRKKNWSKYPPQPWRLLPEYYQWKDAVIQRDNYTCQDCGKSQCEVHAHHVKQAAKYPKLRHDVNNGITLCRRCHIKRHHPESV